MTYSDLLSKHNADKHFNFRLYGKRVITRRNLLGEVYASVFDEISENKLQYDKGAVFYGKDVSWDLIAKELL